MSKWIIPSILISLSIVIVFWAFSPLLITYAKVIPETISYEVGNKESIETAIIQAKHESIEYLRELHGKSILVLSILAMINSIIAVVFILKYRNVKNT